MPSLRTERRDLLTIQISSYRMVFKSVVVVVLCSELATRRGCLQVTIPLCEPRRLTQLHREKTWL
jgi:hypothetical protein